MDRVICTECSKVSEVDVDCEICPHCKTIGNLMFDEDENEDVI